MAEGEVLEQHGGHERFAPRVTISETDPSLTTTIGAGNQWLKPFANPEGGGGLLGVLYTRNATDDDWSASAIAAVDGDDNILSVTAVDGALAMYVRRSDASYKSQIYMNYNSFHIYTTDDDVSIIVSASNTVGDTYAKAEFQPGGTLLLQNSDGHSVSLNSGGIDVVTTDGDFTWNGSTVAVVP